MSFLFYHCYKITLVCAACSVRGVWDHGVGRQWEWRRGAYNTSSLYPCAASQVTATTAISCKTAITQTASTDLRSPSSSQLCVPSSGPWHHGLTDSLFFARPFYAGKVSNLESEVVSAPQVPPSLTPKETPRFAHTMHLRVSYALQNTALIGLCL